MQVGADVQAKNEKPVHPTTPVRKKYQGGLFASGIKLSTLGFNEMLPMFSVAHFPEEQYLLVLKNFVRT